jgi:ubiquinone/menaquinone biosynthesis C-methylase UbiE
MHDALEIKHKAEIVDQFTRQAETFSSVAARTSEEALRLLGETIGIDAEDEVLDVACGPGIVSCWLAKAAKYVVGTDVVPAMIERACSRQTELKLENIEWKLADVYSLPFADNSFSAVVTRYSFHHLLQPKRALSEMIRVCRLGGRIAVCDVTPEEGKTEAYDQLEKMRDPSHVHALSRGSLIALSNSESVTLKTSSSYHLKISIEAQLASSFPPPGHAEIVRELVRKDVGVNNLSVNALESGNDLILQLPISILVWEKR